MYWGGLRQRLESALHHAQTTDLFFSGDDEEEIISQDTDSDVAEQRDGVKVKVKWTQEEVTFYLQD